MAKNELGIDFSFFTSDEASHIDMHPTDSTEKKKRRTRKSESLSKTATEIQSTNQYNSAIEVPYIDSFREEQNALKGTVLQADELIGRVNEDINAIRTSKTLKNKYTYITNLTASASSLLGTKIQGIRELDSIIKTSHELELKRSQMLHQSQTEQNDDMKIMDLYNAFVNAPISAGMNPNLQQTSMLDIIGMPGGNIVDYSTPISSQMTPEQNRMIMENNPNIKEVVVFNQATGDRYFDVIDTSTGQSVSNYPRPDAFLLNDTTIDVRSGIARNRNIEQSWPLVVIGNTEY